MGNKSFCRHDIQKHYEISKIPIIFSTICRSSIGKNIQPPAFSFWSLGWRVIPLMNGCRQVWTWRVPGQSRSGKLWSPKVWLHKLESIKKQWLDKSFHKIHKIDSRFIKMLAWVIKCHIEISCFLCGNPLTPSRCNVLGCTWTLSEILVKGGRANRFAGEQGSQLNDTTMVHWVLDHVSNIASYLAKVWIHLAIKNCLWNETRWVPRAKNRVSLFQESIFSAEDVGIVPMKSLGEIHEAFGVVRV